MSMPGIERVITEVFAVLQTGMSGKLTTLASEYADGKTGAAPDADAYHRYLPRPLPSYPAVIVRAMPENHEPPNVGGEYEGRFQVQIDVITRAEDIPASDVHLWRYWRAIKELLCAANALDCGDCVVQTVDHNQPVITDPESGDELRDVPGLFVVTTYETA